MGYNVGVNKPSAPKEMAIAQLCPSCGLCCNGVLFADVKLQRGDNPKRLSEIGLPLTRKGRSQAFTQPCSCFDGKLCSIYAERPMRCRGFECGVLQRAQNGKISDESGLRVIRETLGQKEIVLALLRRLGQSDESLPLTRRYAKLMAEPIDLSREEEADLRGELMMAVHRLMELVQREFLAAPTEPGNAKSDFS